MPAHALVTVTVRQYDSGGSLNNPWFANVRGTVGGTATVTDPGRQDPDGHPLGPEQRRPHLHHARGPRGRPRLLPERAAADQREPADDQPTRTPGSTTRSTFSFMSGSKGTYAWNCEFPCGSMVASFGGVMGAYGFMSGFVHVV